MLFMVFNNQRLYSLDFFPVKRLHHQWIFNRLQLQPTPSMTATITTTPTPSLAPMTDFMNGMVYFPVGWGGDSRPEVLWTLKNVFAPNGINWIRLHKELCTMDSAKATQIHCDNQGAMSSTEFKWLVKQIHSLGLRVMSEHFDVK